MAFTTQKSGDIKVPSVHDWRTTDADEINKRRLRAREESFTIRDLVVLASAERDAVSCVHGTTRAARPTCDETEVRLVETLRRATVATSICSSNPRASDRCISHRLDDEVGFEK
jgi:hypothetical protein